MSSNRPRECRATLILVALGAAWVFATALQQGFQPGFTMTDPAAKHWDSAALIGAPIAVLLFLLGARWAFERRWALAAMALPGLPVVAAVMLLTTTPLGRKIWLAVLVAPRLGLKPFTNG